MSDLIKKALLAGLGVSAAAAKTAEKELNRLVGLGKVSAAEAEKVLDQLAARGDRQFRESSKSLEQFVLKTVKNAGLARDRELQALKKRVTALEKKLAPGKKA